MDCQVFILRSDNGGFPDFRTKGPPAIGEVAVVLVSLEKRCYLAGPITKTRRPLSLRASKLVDIHLTSARKTGKVSVAAGISVLHRLSGERFKVFESTVTGL